MQIGLWNLGRWAGCAMLSAWAITSLHAAPLTRPDTDLAAISGDSSYARTDADRPHTALASPSEIGTARDAPVAMPAPDRDIGRSVRELTRPVLTELSQSDVAEAVRALHRPDGVDTALGHGGQGTDGREPTERKRNWDGSGQQQASENNIRPESSRDPVRDKIRASVLLSGLIDEIKPWAAGAVMLYVLGYVAKFSLAARRRTVQRQRERRRHHSRRSSPHGSP